MSEYHLMCNITKCRKELRNQAWITCCSHIFCMDHGQVALDKEKCLTCNSTFENEYDIVIMDLNPSEHHKSMILTGLSPEKVLDVASRALNFWTYQVHHDKVLKDEMLKNMKLQFTELSHYCETMISQHKMEIQKCVRENDEKEKELELKNRELQGLVEQVLDKSRTIKNLQSEITALKRKVSMYIQKYGDDNLDDDTVIPLSRYTRAEMRPKCRRYHSPDANPNKPFSFDPVFHS